MPMSPEKYLANTLSMFPAGTFALIVTPGTDGRHEAHYNGLRDTDPMRALEITAAAELALSQHTATLVMGVAEATGKTGDEMLEFYHQLRDERAESTTGDPELTTQEPIRRDGKVGLRIRLE